VEKMGFVGDEKYHNVDMVEFVGDDNFSHKKPRDFLLLESVSNDGVCL